MDTQEYVYLSCLHFCVFSWRKHSQPLEERSRRRDMKFLHLFFFFLVLAVFFFFFSVASVCLSYTWWQEEEEESCSFVRSFTCMHPIWWCVCFYSSYHSDELSSSSRSQYYSYSHEDKPTSLVKRRKALGRKDISKQASMQTTRSSGVSSVFCLCDSYKARHIRYQGGGDHDGGSLRTPPQHHRHHS